MKSRELAYCEFLHIVLLQENPCARATAAGQTSQSGQCEVPPQASGRSFGGRQFKHADGTPAQTWRQGARLQWNLSIGWPSHAQEPLGQHKHMSTLTSWRPQVAAHDGPVYSCDTVDAVWQCGGRRCP